MEHPIQIIITDDKPNYRNALREILAPYHFKISEAENGEELLKMLERREPDVVLLDLEMPVMDGNAAFGVICEKYPHLRVIILSLYDEEVLIQDYIERGAKGYLSKDVIMGNPIVLINAVNKVQSGGTFFYQFPGQKTLYTSRQKELMPLIFEGKTNDEISKEIGIGIRAVEKQRQKIYEINGFGKAVAFYRHAFSKGLQFLGRKREEKGPEGESEAE